jgi:anti-sigma B factor antagonist
MGRIEDGRLAWADGVVDEAGTLTIALSGEIDVASADGVRRDMQPFLGSAPDRVVFDLQKLEFMDSSGIALLVQIANRFEVVEVRNPAPNVLRILEATGLTEKFGL